MHHTSTMLIFSVLCLLAITPSLAESELPEFTPPTVPDTAKVYFEESFSDQNLFESKWVVSQSKKTEGDADIARYDGVFELSELTVPGQWPGDNYMVMSDKAKHYAISARLDPYVRFEDDTLLIQYEINFQQGLDCGGAYMKLISEQEGLDLTQLHDQTGYTIMFGPDKCGGEGKIHFILRYKNPITGEFEEKHCNKKSSDTSFISDKRTHALQLTLHSNGDFDVAVDLQSHMNGNILTDMVPSLLPPEKIPDPEDKKPEEWDEREQIVDPEAAKPEDWDEDAPMVIPDEDAVKPDGWDEDAPSEVPDPDAERPDDWDDEDDGEWEPPVISNPQCDVSGCGVWERPMIGNPSYKGKWSAPMIDNPEYKGVWEPREIPNPHFFEESGPYFKLTPIAAVAFELWSMNEGIAFDNILITDSIQAGNYYLKDGWMRKFDIERDARGERSINRYFDYFVDLANERPYMWALYAAALVLPFVLCCCLIPSRKRALKPTPREAEPEPSEDVSEKPDEPEVSEPPTVDSTTPDTAAERESSDRESPAEDGAGPPPPEDSSDSPSAVRQRTRKTKPRKDT